MNLEIRIDWVGRYFVLFCDGEPVIAFRKYRDARKLYGELS